MLVKKKNPEWFPSENKTLNVGDTIEITDPKQLILNGDVIAIGTEGEEISAYELYSVITHDERSDFEEYLQIKKQKALQSSLEKEKAALIAEKEKLDKKEVKEEVTEKKNFEDFKFKGKK